MERILITATDVAARFMAYVAGVAMLALMLVLVANAIMGQVSSPFQATYEVVSILGLVVAALALADAQVYKSHVAIDIVMSRASKRTQLAVGGVVTLVSIVILGYLARGLWDYATRQRLVNAATEQLSVPNWMIITVLFVGVIGLIMALVGDLGRIVRSGRSRTPEVEIW